MTQAAVPSPAATVEALSTPKEIADVFDVLAAAAHWFGLETNGHDVQPADKARADQLAADARAQLARLDPLSCWLGFESG